jgi:hypothetical protein
MSIQTSAKDKIKYLFNALTGRFDVVQEFNTDRIVTHELGAAGESVTVSGRDIGPFIVFDEQGNVVST